MRQFFIILIILILTSSGVFASMGVIQQTYINNANGYGIYFSYTASPIILQTTIYINNQFNLYNTNNILYNFGEGFQMGIGFYIELYPNLIVDTQNINIVLESTTANQYYQLNIVCPNLQLSTIEIGYKLFSW